MPEMHDRFISKAEATDILMAARKITRGPARRVLETARQPLLEILPTGNHLCKATTGPLHRARFYLRTFEPVISRDDAAL